MLATLIRRGTKKTRKKAKYFNKHDYPTWSPSSGPKLMRSFMFHRSKSSVTTDKIAIKTLCFCFLRCNCISVCLSDSDLHNTFRKSSIAQWNPISQRRWRHWLGFLKVEKKLYFHRGLINYRTGKDQHCDTCVENTWLVNYVTTGQQCAIIFLALPWNVGKPSIELDKI